jgi:cation transporter-like permease
MTMPSERTRAYAYRVALAALALLVLYGVVAGEALDEWAELVMAALGIGTSALAARNTSTQP